MNKTIKLWREGFESSCSETKEFHEFSKVFNKEFKKLIEAAGCSDLNMYKGHFDLNGFFKAPDNSLRYYSMPDVRGASNASLYPNLMIRFVAHDKDWTGGSNNWLSLDGDAETNIGYVVDNTRF